MRVPLLALVLPLAACGSSGSGDCETIGMTHAGSMTATTPDGPFVAECLTVATIGDQLTVTAVGSTSVLEGVLPRTISVGVLRGDTTGTYLYGGSPARLVASYDPGGAGGERVGAGDPSAVVVTQVSPRFEGEFSFQSTDGLGRPTGGKVEGTFSVSREP